MKNLNYFEKGKTARCCNILSENTKVIDYKVKWKENASKREIAAEKLKSFHMEVYMITSDKAMF